MAAFEGIPKFSRGDKYDASPGIVGDGVWRSETLEKGYVLDCLQSGIFVEQRIDHGEDQ